ncbi:hypothetical protein BC827DRAFT_1153071 [Russula dissimulans]|nr:hypothetical protein BC827DRAFT_1153071 [Russula dissimulans]
MNPPPPLQVRLGLFSRTRCVVSLTETIQISSRVRWWDARGQLKHGTVKRINVLNDGSRVVVIEVEDGQPPTVNLPCHNSSSVRNIARCGGAEKHDVNIPSDDWGQLRTLDWTFEKGGWARSRGPAISNPIPMMRRMSA